MTDTDPLHALLERHNLSFAELYQKYVIFQTKARKRLMADFRDDPFLEEALAGGARTRSPEELRADLLDWDPDKRELFVRSTQKGFESAIAEIEARFEALTPEERVRELVDFVNEFLPWGDDRPPLGRGRW